MAEDNTTTCIKCKRSWTAAGDCHCAGCHLHFGNVKAFDAHFHSNGKCKNQAFIDREVTVKRDGTKYPTFVTLADGTIRLNDPNKATRLAKVVTPQVHVPESRSCVDCGRAMRKKPGRGRWPVRCTDDGGTGLVTI